MVTLTPKYALVLFGVLTASCALGPSRTLSESDSAVVAPTFRRLPKYDAAPVVSDAISCYFGTGPEVCINTAGASDIQRSFYEDFDADGEEHFEVLQSEIIPGGSKAEWVDSYWGKLFDEVPLLDCVARHLDEVYALVPVESVFGEMGSLPEPTMSGYVPSGKVNLERWTFTMGDGWPTVGEDNSAVLPIGKPSGRTMLTAEFAGGRFLPPDLRGEFHVKRELVAVISADARSLVPDPDGRFVLVFTKDLGILRVDLSAPGEEPAMLEPPATSLVNYGICEDDVLGLSAPRLGDNIHGERVLLLDDKRDGLWIFFDEDNDGDFDGRRRLGERQLVELGIAPLFGEDAKYMVDPRDSLRWFD